MDAAKTGTFIAGLRRERRLTQQQLADRLCVSFKAVSRWETGRGLPDVENLEALASALDVSIAELLRGERIEGQIDVEGADEVASDAISLVREVLRRRSIGNVAIGFLAGLVVVALVVIRLTSPSTIPYHEGLASVELSDDGTLVMLVEDGVTGCDVNYVEDPDTGYVTAFVSCYTKFLSRVTGTDDLGWHAPDTPHAVTVGSRDTVDRIYYYPGTADWPRDVLLYTSQESVDFDVITLHEPIYNHWVLVATEIGVTGLVAFSLLRSRWYARRVLIAALLPICLALSMVLVLWGRADQVYDTSFYLSGILLLGLFLYGLAVLLVSRWTGVSHVDDEVAAKEKGWRRFVPTVACVILAAPLIPGIIRTRTYLRREAQVIVVPTYESIERVGYPVNELGLTYGPSDAVGYDGQPDLLLVEGNDGVVGYIYTSEVWGEEPHSIEEALASQKDGPYTVLVYESDGVTVIGTFTANTGYTSDE